MITRFVFIAMALAVNSSALAEDQTTPTKFIPFEAFVQNVKTVSAKDYLARPTSKVRDGESFEEMRQHILSQYRGVHVKHSYVIGSQTFDCVPVDQQPSVRDSPSHTIASGPPPSIADAPPGGDRPPAASAKSQPATDEIVDKFGNSVSCEEHTVPMRRVTLEQLSHFRTLQDFLRKGPAGGPPMPDPAKQPPSR